MTKSNISRNTKLVLLWKLGEFQIKSIWNCKRLPKAKSNANTTGLIFMKRPCLPLRKSHWKTLWLFLIISLSFHLYCIHVTRDFMT